MPLEFRFPDTGEGIDAGELIEWHVAEGELVKEDQPMADVETDKATVTIPCPTTGRVLELRIEVGQTVPVGEVMAVFEPVGEADAARIEPPAAVSAGAASTARSSPPLASPAVRRRARELGIDLAQVRGTGPSGRVEAADLERAAPGSTRARGGEQVVPLRGIRRTIARSMTEAWRTIPHIIDYREADAAGLIRWRESIRAGAGDHEPGAAATFTALLVQIAVAALRRHPFLNASIDMEREEITLHGEYNIGIATATPDGLVVPVLRGAGEKRLGELAVELAELIVAARERRLRPDQVARGTFTVNNYGSLGVWLGTPIIKPGEVANLGVGRIQERPVVRDGQIVARPIVALAVSGDHRVLDGHTLAAFVSDVVALIEDPSRCDLESRL